MRLAICTLLWLAALAGTAAAGDERPSITTTVDFAIGSVDIGGVDGFTAPGGHFDVGVGISSLRLAAELDAALWTNEGAPIDQPESGSFSRVGIAMRWHWMDLPFHRHQYGSSRRAGALRLYVEAGLGRQNITAPSVSIARGDVMFGIGMAQEALLGGMRLGGNFGVRVLVADAPDGDVARKLCSSGCPSTRKRDVALFYVFGFAFGK